MTKRRLTDECPTTPSKAENRVLNSHLNKNANNMGSLLSNKVETLPKAVQFITLALAVFFFFGIHNVLQEAMINTEGFTFGVMLGWMEVLGVTLCSGLERSSLPWIGNGEAKKKMVAPICAYPLLTLCLSMSSSLASWSLNYINFPTKVVFRSCKLLPTMLLAVVMGNSKRFTVIEIGSAVAVCAGLIIFAAGDWSLSKPQFHPFGLTLVTLSVFADAVLPNAQEKIFRTYDASKSEVMFFTNVFTLMLQTGSTLLSGDLMGFVHFVMGKPKVEETNYFSFMMGTTTVKQQHRNLLGEQSLESSHGTGIRTTFLLYVIAYVLISHIAVSAHTQVVRKFGGVAAVFVGTARKGMTLVLSFVLFPKESNWKYAAGAALVLGGLTVASLEKQRNRKKKESIAAADVSQFSFPDGSKLELPPIPLNDLDSVSPDDGSDADVERRPLLDVEMGSHRSSPSSTNAPQRRR
mmetsp:Transcript_13631/g.22403  ORF Transcript_13631/g.22403 Transcript_13631/m.22403 type:complete len:464 (+) Transcript_13631:144-1535(+)